VVTPAAYQAGGVSFVDGHSEIKKWHDPGLLKFFELSFTAQTGDLTWLKNTGAQSKFNE
jgi:hypothetical protein